MIEIVLFPDLTQRRPHNELGLTSYHHRTSFLPSEDQIQNLCCCGARRCCGVGERRMGIWDQVCEGGWEGL